jgi:hypothetical protein
MNTIRRDKRPLAAAPPPPPPPIVAMSLARDMADTVGAVGQDRTDILCTALAVGQWLAEVDRPGRWDTLEVAEVLELVPDEPLDRGRFLLTLAGLIGYAGLAGHLPLPDARRCLDQVHGLADDPIIKNYARQAARQFRDGRRRRRRPLLRGRGRSGDNG